MKELDRRILISLILALYCVKSSTSSLLRRATTINVEESDGNRQDGEFQISNYIYNTSKNYSKRRIYTYCNTNQLNCAGLPFYENVMIKQWTVFWKQEGWDPIVLTIEEARQHTDFSKYESLFNNMKFSSNQQHMFYRYLAMASTPGAEWFAESHTIPLRPLLSENSDNLVLPNDGRFTVYDRHVPSLMSGSENEWNRISQEILKEPKATDLEALSHLLSVESNAFAIEQSVMHAKYVIGEEQFDNDICINTQGKRAVRLSINEFQGTGPSIYKWGNVVESFMKVWNGKCRSGRPVMFTYFEPIKSISTSGSMDLLEVWMQSWRDAGWEPVVLDLGDLIRHPRHRDVIDIFEHSNGKYSMSIYDRMCFYRWFAMAVSGGGWMSDIDAFPLHMDPDKYGKELPHKGLLTGYARHIPCLVSGSGSEWNRLAWILVDSYKIHADEFWSDMLALQEVHEILDVFQYKRETVEFHHLYDKNEKLDDPYQMKTGNRDRCLLANDKKIVHFSHWAVRQGIEGVGFSEEDFNNQKNIAVKWIASWKDQCQSNHVQSSQEFNLQLTQEKEISPLELTQLEQEIKIEQTQQSELYSSQLPKSVTPIRAAQEINVQSTPKRGIDPHSDKEDNFKIEW